jgi:mitochondrial fission protein ELM1
MVGGNTKNYEFSNNDAILLSSLLSKISSNHSLPVFISFSRRTSWQVKQIIRANFTSPNIIYDPEEEKFNPYFCMLGCADYIISTADSISMCSEAASSGKPLYIFLPDDFKSKKHRAFIQQLINLGIARKLDSSISLLEDYPYKPLYEVEKISEIIKSNIH